MWMNQRAICCLLSPAAGHPVVKHRCFWNRLAAPISTVRRCGLIAAISPTGRLYLAGQDQPFTSDDICWFLSKLCWQYRRQNMLVIWDGAAIHRSQTVRNWLQSRPGRVHLERLPAYSPALNPVELVWSQLKRSLKNRVFTNLESLQAAVMNEVDYLQADRNRIRCFFRKKEIAFFTD